MVFVEKTTILVIFAILYSIGKHKVTCQAPCDGADAHGYTNVLPLGNQVGFNSWMLDSGAPPPGEVGPDISYDDCVFTETSNDYNYQYVWPQLPDGVKSFTFSVRAASDAHLALSPSKEEDGEMYEIVIGAGANTYSVIRLCHACSNEVMDLTQGILSNIEYRRFSISFENDLVEVSRVGEEEPFLSFQNLEPSFDISYIGISTGFGSEGSWRFCQFDSDSCYWISRGGVDGDRSILLSPCYNATGPSNQILTFAYWLYGDNAGTLTAYVRQGCVTPEELSPDDLGSVVKTFKGSQENQWVASQTMIMPLDTQFQVVFESVMKGELNNGIAVDGISVSPSVRLVGGRNSNEGRVEVFYSHDSGKPGGEWGSVCDDRWDQQDAEVVCRQLGLPFESARAVYRAYFGAGSGPTWLDEVSCLGSEDTLQECLHSGWGNQDCLESQEEDAGVICSNVRLIGGESSNEGRVEVFYNGAWGTVCRDSSWDTNEAMVVCRQLGYLAIGAEAIHDTRFGHGSGNVWLDGVGCSGSEDRVEDCRHNGWGVHNCDHSQDAGVVCEKPGQLIRLVGSSLPNEGTLEVFYDGEWGTVCCDLWDTRDAIVVCRQLGFQATGSYAVHNAYFGERQGAFWLDIVECSGSEESLAECSHGGWGNANCEYHDEDAGVICNPIRVTTIPTTTNVATATTTTAKQFVRESEALMTSEASATTMVENNTNEKYSDAFIGIVAGAFAFIIVILVIVILTLLIKKRRDTDQSKEDPPQMYLDLDPASREIEKESDYQEIYTNPKFDNRPTSRVDSYYDDVDNIQKNETTAEKQSESYAYAYNDVENIQKNEPTAKTESEYYDDTGHMQKNEPTAKTESEYYDDTGHMQKNEPTAKTESEYYDDTGNMQKNETTTKTESEYYDDVENVQENGTTSTTATKTESEYYDDVENVKGARRLPIPPPVAQVQGQEMVQGDYVNKLR